MFDMVTVSKDEKNNIITIKGLFGNRFSRGLEKNLLKKNRLKQLFVNYSALEISFHEFFALEVRNLLLGYLDLPFSKNEVTVTNAINAIVDNTWLGDMDREFPDNFDYSILDEKMVFDILPHQKVWFSEYNASKKRHHYRGRLLAAGAGLGKALKFDTPVRTSNGWKMIGLLKVGDQVLSKDGTYTNVNGVYPQGKRDIYRITFRDGRSTDCDLNHLWEVYDKSKDKHLPKSNRNKPLVLKTDEIINRFNSHKSRKQLYIDLPEPDSFDNKENLLIDPYLLGVLIGDGCLRQQVSFSNNDSHVINRVKEIVSRDSLTVNKLSKYDYSITNTKYKTNPLKTKLEFYGLFGKLSFDKFIPPEYIDSSVENRLRLLNGLMDTDGTVDGDTPTYSTSSKRLADEVQLVIRSLGGMVKMSIKNTHYFKNDVKIKCRPSYRLSIRFKKPKSLFSLPRQKDKLKEVNQYSNNLKLRIESIVKLDRQYEAVCIAVDHPSKLFVIKDYVVTHNTYMSMATAELLKSNKIVVLCPIQAIEEVWIDNIKNELYKKEEGLYTSLDKGKYNNERIVVYHYEAMSKLGKIIPLIKGKDTTVIIDESHNMNEEDSKRTKLMIQICKEIGTENILLLSGSPIKAVPLEMLPMIEILDKGFTPVIKKRFQGLYKSMPKFLKTSIQERYTGYRTYIDKKEVKLPEVITESVSVKLKNAKEYTLESIKKKMKIYADDRIKELKKDYLEYLNTYQTLYDKAKDELTFNDMSPKDFELYEKTVKQIKVAYEERRLMFISDKLKYANRFEKEVILPVLDSEEKKQFKEAKTIVKYLNLKVQGEILGLVVGKERINCHVDMAKVLNFKKIINTSVNKTIVFSNYVEVCNAVVANVEKIGYNPLKVYGADTKYLADTVSKFMVPDNELNPLVTTYKSLSTAVPLIAANIMINMDMPFRSYIYDQAIARIHRIGQKKTVYAFQVHLDTGDVPNINSRNIDIIEWSKSMVEDITGVSTDLEIIRNEGSDEGKKTLELNNFLDMYYSTETITIEKKKEICITDSW